MDCAKAHTSFITLEQSVRFAIRRRSYLSTLTVSAIEANLGLAILI